MAYYKDSDYGYSSRGSSDYSDQYDDYDYQADEEQPEEQLSRIQAKRDSKLDFIRMKQHRLAVRLNWLIVLLLLAIIATLLVMRFVNF